MKKSGVMNRDIAAILARLGHTDKIIIADCGLPIPESVPYVDLSIKKGTPSFLNVLKAVSDDIAIEGMTLAHEIKESNKVLHDEVLECYGNIPTQYIKHDVLKEKIKETKALIRTGEATPYANVILHAGVIF